MKLQATPFLLLLFVFALPESHSSPSVFSLCPGTRTCAGAPFLPPTLAISLALHLCRAGLFFLFLCLFARCRFICCFLGEKAISL